ncbi:L,D-transpeptidase [Mesorhizobium sp. ZC-5]|uniref:L,D-transpeptidase n=1 Tax=Mesorhizobium sp. ZC-5 TaxID=2986066 RepID=UPI0021E9A4CF|nr:L,D-transpeptidase [Mesorhizobium sp. ZC-5]MCV3241271.1 L,D-transpeptidase [Mesorhizobium sp. ZC-5]
MISRSLVLLGLGVALVFGAPSIATAQTATKKTAAVEQVKPKPKAKAKTSAKSNKKNKTASKGKAKKTTAKEVEKAEEKPVGLFAVLFKPNDKAKSAAKAKPEPKLSAKAAARAKEKAQKEASRKEILQPMEPIRAVQPRFDPEVASFRNDGELRSEQTMPRSGFFGALFGDDQVLLPETRTLDTALAQKESRKKFKVASQFEPQVVEFSGYPRGTIVIDTANHFLYLVEGLGSARRYGIAVGKDGLQYKGQVKVGDKQEWPRWIPTKEMQEREPKKYGQYKDGMPGGGENPLGARAIYLYEGKKDTHLRIHGTIAPQSIGTNSSNGCFRMVNDHVIDLYRRVKVGTNVVVL